MYAGRQSCMHGGKQACRHSCIAGQLVKRGKNGFHYDKVEKGFL